jgi:hypothetical protein
MCQSDERTIWARSRLDAHGANFRRPGRSVWAISPGHQSGPSVRAISPGHQCRAGGPAPFVSAMLFGERGRYCQRVRIDHQRDALTHFGPVG